MLAPASIGSLEPKHDSSARIARISSPSIVYAEIGKLRYVVNTAVTSKSQIYELAQVAVR